MEGAGTGRGGPHEPDWEDVVEEAPQEDPWRKHGAPCRASSGT